MLGKTPPSLIVVFNISLFNSSSFLMANKICLGTILVFLLSFAAFPANSKTSAAKYSRTAAKYTGAPAPTLSVYLPYLKYLAILPTGNYKPALVDLEVYLTEACLPLALPFPPVPVDDIFF